MTAETPQANSIAFFSDALVKAIARADAREADRLVPILRELALHSSDATVHIRIADLTVRATSIARA